MKFGLTTLAAALIIIGGAGCSKTTSVADPPSRGAVVFAENCSVCHEVDGTGRITSEGTRLAPSLHGVAEKYPLAKHLEIVTLGGRVIQGGSMPAWGRLLSSQDIEAVVEYERTTFVNAS